jgi:hypothetical protein
MKSKMNVCTTCWMYFFYCIAVVKNMQKIKCTTINIL